MTLGTGKTVVLDMDGTTADRCVLHARNTLWQTEVAAI